VSGGEPGAPAVVLYRCRTPTNVLCPCGAVERRLRRLGIDHRTERVAYRKPDRPEIVELTGQKRVPVLVDGDEVIHDSKRILEYLEHAHGGDREAPSGRAEGGP
jgi:glutathione S-transferase